MQSSNDYILFTTLRLCWTIPSFQNDIWLVIPVLFIFIGRMPFLASSLDNADPPFALVITLGFYLHHVEVADQDPSSVSL